MIVEDFLLKSFCAVKACFSMDSCLRWMNPDIESDGPVVFDHVILFFVFKKNAYIIGKIISILCFQCWAIGPGPALK